jgi:hypothetical protein
MHFDRAIKSWLHVLPFPRKGLSTLKSLLLTLKSLRLPRVKGKGRYKVLLKGMAP